jgi:putative DNA primase/helicase
MRTTEAARGKWRRILGEFGIESRYLDGRHHACPVTGEGEDRFRFADRDGSGSFFCACSDGRKGGAALIECKTGKSFREVADAIDAVLGNLHEKERRAPTYAERLRLTAKTTRRSAYLESRGLEIPPGLLFATNVEYRDDGKVIGRFPAMLAPIVRHGKFQTYHVTYLDRGSKAQVPCPRKILPGGQISGGGIALYPPAERMGVGEGIETCIAAKMLHGIPTHSALNAEMLAKWEPPSVAKVVVIFADHDRNYAGHKGAYALAHRLVLKGLDVEVCFPPQVDTDWNDLLLSQRRAA